MRENLFCRFIRFKVSLRGRTSTEKSARRSIFGQHLAAVLIGALLVLIDQLPARAGSFQTVILVPHATTKGSLQQDVGNLPPLSPVERELKGGETHSYQLSLVAGQFLYAQVEQQGIDVTIDVFDPGGQKIADVDSPNDNWGAEPILLVAGLSGNYRVDIRSPNKTALTGRYEIKIIASRKPTATDLTHFAAERAFNEGRMLRAQPNVVARRSAIEKYEQALPFFRDSGESYRQALTLLSIGFAYAQLSEFRRALVYFNETLSLAQNLKERRLEAATETFLGGMQDVLGDIGTALDHYNRALTLSRESGNRQAEASSLNNIGATYFGIAYWQKALEYYSQALPHLRALGNQRGEANTLNNIGVAYNMLGEQQKALDYLQQSLLLRRSTSDRNGEAYTLSNIGSAHSRYGEYHKALDYYNQAQAIQRETGNRAQEAETLDLIGTAYSEVGQPEKALEYHQQALQIQRATGNIRREAISLSNLGQVYNLLSQPDKALDQFNQALSIFRNIGDLNNAAVTLEGSARSRQMRGDLDEARKHIEESLTLIETVRARSGSQQLRASYRASMEKVYEFYIDLLMQQHAANPSLGHDAEAFQASERGRARSLLELLSEAHVDIRQGVDTAVIERERNLAQLLNAKAQRQIQLMARKGSQDEIATLKKEISTLEDEYQQVQTTIRKTSPGYAALTQPQPLSLKEIQQQLDPDTLLLEYSLGEERSYMWAVAQKSLKSYVLPKRGETEKVARRVYELLTTRSLSKPGENAAVKQQRIAQADSQLLEASGELSQMVLGPVASELGTKRLVVVADGALQYVPFGALQRPSVVSGQLSTAKNARTVNRQLRVPTYRPFVVDHEIISLPSASALAVQRTGLVNRKPRRNAVAVIADPVFSVGDERLKASVRIVEPSGTPTGGARTRMIEHLADDSGKLVIRRLPFTRQEAEQILAVAPRASNLKAIDFKANRSTAIGGELSQYRYVHFATHGYLDSERPDLSAIVLSLVDEQGKPQDGFLRALEIYNLNLPAELVVLSACQTGLGKEIKGEGLMGLTRGFMYAGARRVVVSMWNVNDKATADLMTKFYEKMLKQGERPAAALRAAQVEMWKQKQWQSPYYWAAFTMQGEWR
jgi:CHAT domain-containing protein